MQEQTRSIASVLTRAEQAHEFVFHYVGGEDSDCHFVSLVPTG